MRDRVRRGCVRAEIAALARMKQGLPVCSISRRCLARREKSAASTEDRTGDGTVRACVTPPTHLTRAVMRYFAGRAGLDGRYWARTSDPQLVDSGQRFASGR
jgi:hypothetical protein